MQKAKIQFKVNAVRWLSIILDLALHLKAYIDLKIEKVIAADARVRGIPGKYGMAPGLTRPIHIIAV